MRIAVLVFPGSNCDYDCYHVLKYTFDQTVDLVWHKGRKLDGYDAVVIPGGFSYGDYLRTGAIARFSGIMKAVEQFSEEGGYVLGICNGFQILLEAGLLPGAMLRNRDLKFICREVYIRAENNTTPFTHLLKPGQILRMPIAHADGNFYADPKTLEQLETKNQIVFRYCDVNGKTVGASNPNGSKLSIAGICNERGNVVGLMPHPERCTEGVLGNIDGKLIFESMLSKLSMRA